MSVEKLKEPMTENNIKEFKHFLNGNEIKLNLTYTDKLKEINCIYMLGDRKLLIEDVLIDPFIEVTNKNIFDTYIVALGAQGKIGDNYNKLFAILHGDLPDLDEYEICEVESSNGSNDSDITIDEFKDFLEKNHINIDISQRMHDGILRGKFHILPHNIIAVYEVESVFHSIYQMEDDILFYHFISLLAKKENLKDVRDAILSAIKDDEYITYKIESPDGSKEIEGSLEEAEIVNSKGIVKISIREETLDAAKKCVMGDREQDYGTPESNFATIASFWSDYLDMNISAQQVADMMILMKISRIKNGGGTGDSYVDIAGYAACGNEILSKTHK